MNNRRGSSIDEWMNRADLPPKGPLVRFNPAQPGAAGMKAAATGLLVLMAGVFFTTRALEPQYPWLGFVKAFAEATNGADVRQGLAAKARL